MGVAGAGEPPLGFLADDNTTVVGSEVDIASLVADSLGLELEVVNVAWEQWPLGLQSGDLEAVFSNVGVNAERLELFDFATYRQGVMAFTAPTGSDLSIESAEDIAGLTVAVGSGTNQERILLDWNAENEAAGREPATLEYYANAADTLLALQSGRIDTYLGPNPELPCTRSRWARWTIVGTVNAGWPNTTYVAATSLKGNGLVDAFQAALEHVFEDGSYEQTLERWGLVRRGRGRARGQPGGGVLTAPWPETPRQTDVVVVGGGVMGSAAAWALARRGRRRRAARALRPGHSFGASHGRSRIYRSTYAQPHHQALVAEARRLWAELEAETGTTLLHPAPGVTTAAPPGLARLREVAAAMERGRRSARVAEPPPRRRRGGRGCASPARCCTSRTPPAGWTPTPPSPRCSARPSSTAPSSGTTAG